MLRSVRPSVRLSHAPSSTTVLFSGQLQNTNRNLHAGSRTHWSEWPYGHRKWPKRTVAYRFAAIGTTPCRSRAVRVRSWKMPQELCPELRIRKISPRQVESIALSTELVVVVNGRVCWRHLYTTVDESWLFTTSRSTVTLRLYSICCRFVIYNLFLHLTRF